MKNLEIGAIYKHYKGNNYEIIGIAKNSDTLEDFVVYRGLYESPEFGKNSLWIRPKEMFLENVIVDGKEIKRFEKIEQEVLIKPNNN